MLRCSARPYEGREKYIFVSYSHRDRELVYPIIEKMTADGYRIWYDEGVAPDSEWPEYIAAHLDGSYACLAMVSGNSMRSQNCRREINFALSREKPLTVVYLEDTQIPLGMEMQLSVTQPVYKYLFEEDTDFYNKLYCAESLNECREEKKLTEEAAAAVKAVEIQTKKTDKKEKKKKDRTDSKEKKEKRTVEKAVKKARTAKNKSNKKLGLIIAAAAAAVVLALILIFSGGGKKQETVEIPENSLHILLNAPDGLTFNGREAAEKTVRERLDILAGEDGYLMLANYSNFDLYVNKDRFNGCDPETVMKDLVAIGGNSSIFKYLSYEMEGAIISIDEYTVDPSSFESVTAMTGSPAAGVGDCDYLEVVFTDEYAEKCVPIIEAWGKDFYFAPAGRNGFTGYKAYCTDSDTVYRFCMEELPGENFAKLKAYNMTHEGLEASFDVCVYMDVKWEKTDELAAAGANQCNADELENTYMTAFTYKSFTYENGKLTAGEALLTEKALKERLDAWGKPYAFGSLEDEDKTVFAVKTGLYKMGTPVMQLLCATGFEVGGAMTTLNVDAKDVSVTDTGIDVYLDVTEGLTEKLFASAAAHSGKLYFRTTAGGRDPADLLYAECTDSPANGVIHFDKLCFDGGGEYSGNQWIGEIIRVIKEGTPLTCLTSLGDYELSAEPGTTPPKEKDFGIAMTDDAKRMEEIIKTELPDCRVDTKDGGRWVTVYLDLPVDATLPESAVETVKALYGKLDFEGSVGVKTLSFYYTEDNSEEQAYAIFSKNICTLSEDSEDTDGVAFASGSFYGGRLERYKEDYAALMETDEFFAYHIGAGMFGWIYDTFE